VEEGGSGVARVFHRGKWRRYLHTICILFR
jgi:hypothetical protein